MKFRGWPADAFEFYRGLEVDNSKAYWQANKQRYEASVKEPFLRFVADDLRIGVAGRALQ